MEIRKPRKGCWLSAADWRRSRPSSRAASASAAAWWPPPDTGVLKSALDDGDALDQFRDALNEEKDETERDQHLRRPLGQPAGIERLFVDPEERRKNGTETMIMTIVNGSRNTT